MSHFHHFTARVFVYRDGKVFDRMIKYHRIDHRSPGKVQKFEQFIKGKYPGVHHINYYSGDKGEYQYQTRF